jgi:CBS domain containing-hemolysin-like protein
MSYVSSEALGNVGNILAFVILFIFIAIGILFDIIGMAATSATEKEFHSMASRKVSGAKEAVWLSRNASKVSSLCNDVVGDISGIISGATGALIVARLTSGMDILPALLTSLTITGLIAALTIGGKAIGKGFGIGYSVKIVFAVGKILSILPIRFDKK